MANKVYAVRLLVETGEEKERVEKRIRDWGEATFDGFVSLELTQVKTSLADIDSLAHVIAKMVNTQEKMQSTLVETITVLTSTCEQLQGIANLFAKKITSAAKESGDSAKDKAQVNESHTE